MNKRKKKKRITEKSTQEFSAKFSKFNVSISIFKFCGKTNVSRFFQKQKLFKFIISLE